jgi:hypothetical protein
MSSCIFSSLDSADERLNEGGVIGYRETCELPPRGASGEWRLRYDMPNMPKKKGALDGAFVAALSREGPANEPQPEVLYYR